MKKYIATTAILLAGWTLIPSCSTKHPEKVAQIDAMIVDLEQAQKCVDSINIELVSQLYKASDKQIQFLQKNYKNDTISRQTALMLGDFRTSYKSLKKLKKMHGRLTKEIEFTESQLMNLKTDIESNLLTDEKIQEHFESEGKAMDFIRSNSTKLTYWQKRAISLNNATKPKIDSLVLDMNRNGIR